MNSFQQIADTYVLVEITMMNKVDAVMNIQLARYFNLSSFTSFEITASILTIIGFFGSFSIYYSIYTRNWEKGVFPPLLSFTRINHFEAIVCLSANIIRCNKENYSEKRMQLVRHIQYNFPEHSDGVSDSLLEAFQTPISTESIAYWLNKHLRTIGEKLKILDLLYAIATIDGHVLKNEYRIIEQFCSLMGIPNQEYTQRWEAHNKVRLEHEKRERSKVEKPKESSSLILKNKCLSLFGLPIDSSKETIKKSYRKLVKANHPDMFKDASLAEKQVISERFIEIQEAYEYLMNLP